MPNHLPSPTVLKLGLTPDLFSRKNLKLLLIEAVYVLLSCSATKENSAKLACSWLLYVNCSILQMTK